VAIQADGSQLLLGRGKTFFKRNEAAGTAQGHTFMGQVTQLEIRPKDEVIDEKSSVEAAAPIIKQVKVSTDHEIALTFKEMKAHNLALALFGTVGSYTQAATAVTNEIFTDVKQGTYIKTAKRLIGSVVVTGPSATPTYTVTTDYVVEDATEGLIYIVPGGTITDGSDLEVDYTPTAVAAPGLDTVIGGVSSFIEGELLFIPDPATGPKWRAEIWKASLNSNAVIALIQSANEFASAELLGKVLSDATNHPTEPYYRLTRVGIVS